MSLEKNFGITEEKLREVADRYGFTVEKVDNPENAGFVIDGKTITADGLFGTLFHQYVDNATFDKVEDEYNYWNSVINYHGKDFYDFLDHEEMYSIAFAHGFVSAIDKSKITTENESE